MATILAHEPAVEHEVGELRAELTGLRGAMASLEDAFARTNHVREVTAAELARHRALRNDALDLQAALEHRVGELEAELATTRRALGRQRLVSAIRAKLLTDARRTRLWRRRSALERADRVEALLGRSGF
jgi:phage-related tail protein